MRLAREPLDASWILRALRGSRRLASLRYAALLTMRAEAVRERDHVKFIIQLSNSPTMLRPRSPDEAKRNPGAEFAIRIPDYASLIRATVRHASSPRVLSGSRARRSSLFLFPRRGVRNDRAFHRARGAMCRSTWLRVLEKHTAKHSHGSSSTPAFRTRMDFAACCIAPRGCHLRRRAPGSCELSPGHALGPSARLAGVCPCKPPSRISDPESVFKGPAS